MFGSEMQLWKLHTVQDYIMFFGYIAAGILVFTLIARHMKSQRNDLQAAKQTAKRLERLAKRPRLLIRQPVSCQDKSRAGFDALLMTKQGIWLVKAYGWGINVYGTADGPTWRREDAKRKETFANPLPELKAAAEALRGAIEKQCSEQVPVEPLVVFSDTMQTPTLYIGYGSCAVTYPYLRTWLKEQNKKSAPAYDFEKVSQTVRELYSEA